MSETEREGVGRDERGREGRVIEGEKERGEWWRGEREEERNRVGKQCKKK